MPHRFLPPLLLATCLLSLECSCSPATTPSEQYFADVKSNLAALDYNTALKNLDRLIQAAGDQPLGEEGKVLRAALLTALADGSKHMAETYEAGLKERAAQARIGQFTRMRADYYGICRVRLLDAMQTVMGQRAKLGDKPILLHMAFPDFIGIEIPVLGKIKGGYLIEDADRYRAETESNRNALARIVASLVGAGGDVNKGRQMFSTGSAEIDPRVYLIELSDAFLRLCEIFERQALDDPRYLRLTNEVIRDNMDIGLKLLATRPDKDLEAHAKKIRGESEKRLKALGT